MTQDGGNWNNSYDDYLSDNDMKEAWEELNRFLDDEEPLESSGNTKRPPESLRKDYEILGIPFGADFSTVKRAYREQLRLYHPDLHAGDPEKQRNATDTTRKIIIAFRRIRDYYENGAA